MDRFFARPERREEGKADDEAEGLLVSPPELSCVWLFIPAITSQRDDERREGLEYPPGEIAAQKDRLRFVEVEGM